MAININDDDLDDLDVSVKDKSESESELKGETKCANGNESMSVCINPYLISPEKALAVMGRICSAKPSNYIKKWKSTLNDILFYVVPDDLSGTRQDEPSTYSRCNIESHFVSRRKLFANQDFLYHLRKYLVDLLLAMDRQMRHFTPKTVKIAVGGAFSGAKSSFINRILDSDNLLPVDVGATTMVPAMLYCGNFPEMLSVSGVNQLNAIVRLDSKILNCVSHSDINSSNVAANIATALQHFIVKIDKPNYDNIVFIDTPGYDNPEQAGSRLATDDEIADKYISMGDVVLWLMPVTNGSLKPSDIERLMMLGGKQDRPIKTKSRIDPRPRKVIILITKADLNPKEGRRAVFNLICSTVESMDFVMDVAMISTSPYHSWDEYWLSRSGDDFNTMLRRAVSQVKVNHETSLSIAKIQNLFGAEIAAAKDAISQLEQMLRAANVHGLNCLKMKKDATRDKTDFFEKYPNLPADIRARHIAQFDSDIKSIEEDYIAQRQCVRDYTDKQTAVREHLNLLSKLSLDLENWFISEPILDYHGKDTETTANSVNTLQVYFKTGRQKKATCCYIHFWDENSSTCWPGLPMEFVESDKGAKLWRAEIPISVAGIVFAIVDEDGNVCDQSIDFTGKNIQDSTCYYKTRKGKKIVSNRQENRVSASSYKGTAPVSGITPAPTQHDESIIFSEPGYIFKVIKAHNYDNLIKCLSSKYDVTGSYNKQGMSVVTAAAHYGFRQALNLLVMACGTRVLNIADARGYNALHSAASALKFETCADLLRWDPTLKEYDTLDGTKIANLVAKEFLPLLEKLLEK